MESISDPFVASLIENFSTMFGCSVRQSECHEDNHMHSTRDVTGIIGLTGKADGNVVLSFDLEVALSLTDAMLGQRPAKIDEDVIDAVGETVNIVVGQAKSQLSVLELNLGIPTVVAGRDQTVRFTRPSGTLWFTFESEWGKIDMCVGLAKSHVDAEQPCVAICN